MANFGQMLSSFLIFAVAIIGPIFLFGFLIQLISRRFYRLCGENSKAVAYATGWLGTPVHELSHALMCLIFGHKILEIKLFQMDCEDGVLGYVRHSYNPKNFYQRLGKFFIGVAPIVIGCLILTLLMLALVNSFFVDALYRVDIIYDVVMGTAPAIEGFRQFFSIFGSFFLQVTNPLWWVYFVLGMFLALHMNLSPADIKGSIAGMIFLLIVFFVLAVILGLVGVGTLASITADFVFVGLMLLLILSQSLFFCLVWWLGAYLVTIPKRKRERRGS